MTDEWKEIEVDNVHMPEGYVGNLTAGHEEKLMQLWESFFSVCDRATGTTQKGGDFNKVADWGTGTDDGAIKQKMSAKNAIKNSGIERDDQAKEMASKRTEEANMEQLLKTYGPEALRNTFWSLCQQDHPDTTMLRFLRARKWDVDRATAMMASTLKWRLDVGVDQMSHNGDLTNDKLIPKYIDQQATGKVYAMGCNIHDQPVCYVHFKKHLIWGQPSATMKKFIICQMESWRLLFVPPNDKMVILFDSSGFGPSNLDMPNFLYVLQCLQSYFPECLAVLYLHNAPWILRQAWALVKGLLDPVVRQKVVFTSGVDDLLETIPEDRLLRFVGGNVDQDFEWIGPEEGENDQLLQTDEADARWAKHRELCEQFEAETRKWIASSNKSTSTEQRRILAKKLRLSQFDYEPFWRGLTVHHRNGDLPPGNPGIIRWQYTLKNGEKIRQIIGQRQCRKTLLRELSEIQVGAPVDFVEARTNEMLEDGSWGSWSTCDDLPPSPTAFRNGKLEYEGEEGTNEAIAPAVAATATTSSSLSARSQGTAVDKPVPAAQNGERAATLRNKTQRAAPPKMQAAPPKTSKHDRKSFFGSLRSKIMA